MVSAVDPNSLFSSNLPSTKQECLSFGGDVRMVCVRARACVRAQGGSVHGKLKGERRVRVQK
jgi:hypothetical protein